MSKRSRTAPAEVTAATTSATEPIEAVDPRLRGREALVVTVSDSTAAGKREDVSGAELTRRLQELGLTAAQAVVPDDVAAITEILSNATGRYRLVLTTGGTGLTPRDVTPQATRAVLEYEIPGIAELMRASGGRATPYAYLSRAIAGVANGCLIVNMPGSPRGALESLQALEPILAHALETVAGPFDHGSAGEGGVT